MKECKRHVPNFGRSYYFKRWEYKRGHSENTTCFWFLFWKK